MMKLLILGQDLIINSEVSAEMKQVLVVRQLTSTNEILTEKIFEK